MGRAEGGLVAHDHRLGEQGALVEGRVDQLHVIAPELVADGSAKSGRQERAQQPLGVLTRSGRGGHDGSYCHQPSGRRAGCGGTGRFSAFAFATDCGSSGTSPKSR